MSQQSLSEETEARILDAYRRWGYLQAELDPLGRLEPRGHLELEEGEEARTARRYYCGPIAVEFMHIPDAERRRWIQERMEGKAGFEPDRERILELLIRAATLEQVLQSRYLGTKRFSLEGLTALIPVLVEILECASDSEAEEAVVAMSHRGRLNVMLHVVGKSAQEVMVGFEDVDPRSVLGGGDVKYHLGATGTFEGQNGSSLQVRLVSNPSHLEAVDPVAMGRVRAKQSRLGEGGWRRVLPIQIHGDAAFAGQGILAETLNLAELDGFSVGGTVHVVVNNLIGFTTEARAYSSTRFATDVAKRLPVPVFHVNGQEPEAAVRAARLAVEYRYAFCSDVVLDLIGYRRHGHSEVDDPSITQPVLYRKIEELPPLWQRYAEASDLSDEAQEQAERIREELQAAQQEAGKAEKKPRLYELPGYWKDYHGGDYEPQDEVDTGLSAEEIEALSRPLATWPDDFSIHAKVKRLLEQRGEMGRGERPIDFGMAEALAFASLVKAGVPVRLSGQDSRRGTFNQRHSVLIDSENEEEYCPLCHVDPEQARFEIYDSMLSEAAVMGFEYGFSRDYPEALVLWEAQFGDFVNGAQVILDQFVTPAEDKWGLLSGLVLLLPHGYEGQGPEHSSARMERFLQLAAEDNTQICQPSTAGQYFHLLRRQTLRKWRKPLVVFTPKSMLRHKAAASKRDELGRSRFLPVLPDEAAKQAERILLCSGKIGHELRAERDSRADESLAIVSVEQLYPFPEKELTEELDRHQKATEVVWVQEEPANMGALFFVLPRLERLARGRPVRSIKRSASASPATGSAKAHQLEQKTLLSLAFGVR